MRRAKDTDASRHLRVLVILIFIASSGCNLTHVSAPDIVQPPAENNAAGAILKRNGAIADFATAFGDQVFFSGLIADEFTDVSGGALPADARRVNLNNGGGYPYDAFSGARMDALLAIASLKRFAPAPAPRIGEMFAYLGFTETMFAENLCSGVPLGIISGTLPAYGPTLSRQQLIRQALSDFDSAAAYSSTSDSISNLIRVGQGRALLDSGDFAAAATAVSAVPLSYQYQTYYAAAPNTPQTNGVYNYVVVNSEASVSNDEGQNGLNFITASDPRVATDSVGAGIVGPIYNVAAYGSYSSPITLASGVEAALVEAEAELRAGQVSAWASTLNTLRSTAISPAIPPLSADSTTLAPSQLQLAVLFRERAFWLFATGHRQGDLRRLIRQYNLPIESVFPSGLYEGGPRQYGTDVTFVPFAEQSNPNYHGCANRDP